MKTGLTRLAAASVAGVCYGLPFVVPDLAPLAFIGIAPVLIVLAEPRRWTGVVWLSFLAAAVGAFLVALPLQTLSNAAVVIVASLILPWPFCALLAFTALRRRTGWPIALLWPCCWIVAEWGWSFHSVAQLAFGLSGYTQFVFPRLIQFAELTGVLGVSFLVQAVVGSLAEAVVAWSSAPAAQRRAALAEKRVRLPLLACGGAVAMALAWGTLRLWTARPTMGPRLALVQPAVPHKDSDAHMQLVQLRQLGLGRKVRPGDTDLIVFPENAVLRYIEGSSYLAEFQDLSKKTSTPLLVGVAARPKRLPPLARPNEGYAHNSAAIITGDGLVDRYDKIHMMPFSEQVPGEAFFHAFGRLEGYRKFIVSRLGYRGKAVPGDEVRLLRIPGQAAPMWTPICFEQADARLAREAATQGARFFVNITSEGDLGPQIYQNTLAVTILRAVELRVGIARCGNVGITGMIDPWGRQTAVLRGKTGALWGEPGVLRARVPLGSGKPTIYARLGDWPAGASALVLLAACVMAVGRRRTS